MHINGGPNMEHLLAHWIRVETRGFASGKTPSHVQQFFPVSSQMCKPFPSIRHQLLLLFLIEFADVQHISVFCHSFWVFIRLAPFIHECFPLSISLYAIARKFWATRAAEVETFITFYTVLTLSCI